MGGAEATGMREIVFVVTADQPGRIEAKAQEWGLVVEAPTLEELHHEARDALISQVGPSHGTYRIRIRRDDHPAVPASGDQSAQRHPLPKGRPIPTGKPIGSSRGIGRAIGGELDRTGPISPISPITVVNYARSPEAALEVVATSTAAGIKTWGLYPL